MLFWTQDKFAKFIEAVSDKTLSYAIFMTFYYTGIREGELLALTPSDIDFDKKTLTINKSYQRINREDVITTPKTPKSNRVVSIPQSLCDCLSEYMSHCYALQPTDRLFPCTKSYLQREMERGCKLSGIKKKSVCTIFATRMSSMHQKIFYKNRNPKPSNVMAWDSCFSISELSRAT